MTTSKLKTANNKNLSDYKGYNCAVTQKYIKKRLEEANISVNRGVDLKQGTKRPAEGTSWRGVDLPPVDEIDGHFGIRTGDGLVVIDVDYWDDLPDSVKNFLESNPTLTIESPHSEGQDGHYYFATDSNINKNPTGCEIQGDGALVADGARIWGIRDGKDCPEPDGDCCTRDSPGVYTVREDREIAYVPTDEIESIVPDRENTKSDSGGKDHDIEIPEYDSDIADFAEREFGQLRNESIKFFTEFSDRLQGGTGHFEEQLISDGQIDRSKLDTLNMQHLYAYFFDTQQENHERAIELAYNLYTSYCDSHEWTVDGQKRKWITRGDEYREHCIGWAINQLDLDRYRMQLRKSTKNETINRKKQNIYGKPTYGFAEFMVYLVAGEYEDLTHEQIQNQILPLYEYSMTIGEIQVVRDVINPHKQSYYIHRDNRKVDSSIQYPYPLKSAVSELCERANAPYKGVKANSWGKVLQEIQQEGLIKVAEIESFDTYVVYPPSHPDPVNTNWIKQGGEEIEQSEQTAKAKATI